MNRPLEGRTIALPETRDLEALAALLEAQGAVARRCPLVRIVDAPDPRPVEAWIGLLLGGAFSDVILLTGEGLRRILGVAGRIGQRDAAVAALGQTRRITRGAKPVRALTDIGLRTDVPAAMPTTDGVIASLRGLGPLSGRHFGVQLYGEDPNEKLIEFLRDAGTQVSTVSPYVYTPAGDDQRVRELIDDMAAGKIDAIAFTSAPQAERLWEIAVAHGWTVALHAALERTRVAAVGPVVGEELQRHGVTPTIMPTRNFFMNALVKQLIEAFASNP